jgi:hypothetical protein
MSGIKVFKREVAHIPEDSIIRSHRRENLKPYTFKPISYVTVQPSYMQHVFLKTFLEVIPFKIFGHHTKWFDRYGHHVLKLLFDGNCCAVLSACGPVYVLVQS